MNFLSLPVAELVRPDAPDHAAVGLWIKLLAWSALLESGGRLAPNVWRRVAPKRSIEAVIEARLATWWGPPNGELLLEHYPNRSQERAVRNRANGMLGGIESGKARSKSANQHDSCEANASSEGEAYASGHALNVGGGVGGDGDGDGDGEEGAISARPEPEISPEARDLANYLADAIRSHTPDAKINPRRWARDIERALRIDRRSVEDLRRVIDFAHRSADDFWRPNLLSGEKLRKKFEVVRAQADRAGFRTLAAPSRLPRLRETATSSSTPAATRHRWVELEAGEQYAWTEYEQQPESYDGPLPETRAQRRRAELAAAAKSGSAA